MKVTLCAVAVLAGVAVSQVSPTQLGGDAADGITRVQAAPSAGLGDGDECEEGEDCTCGNVTCAVGCTCEMTGPTGICVDCPIPETPPAFPWAVVLAGIAVVVVVVLLIARRRGTAAPG